MAGDTKRKVRTAGVTLGEIVIDCAFPQRLATFWAEALDYEVTESDPDMAAIEDPRGGTPGICFQRVPEPKLSKNRVHFDLCVDEERFQETVDRLVALGAMQIDVGQGPDRVWIVLADPERNEFCLVP